MKAAPRTMFGRAPLEALKRLRRRPIERAHARMGSSLGVWSRSPIDARPAPVAWRDAGPTRP
jgi:hypothetical protein